MNKKFAILISVTAVLLFALLVVLSVVRRAPKESTSIDQSAVPTVKPVSRKVTGDRTSSTLTAPAPTLQPEQKNALTTIERSLPYTSDSLAIDYSALTNKIYVEKKNEKADLEFQKFLIDNGLEEIYKSHPELFITSKSNLQSLITSEEQKLEFSPEEDAPTQDQSPTPTLSYSEQRSQNQTISFNTLFKNLASFKIPGSESSDKLVVNVVSGNSLTAPGTSTVGQPINLTYGNNTTNIPCAAGTDYGAADGYTNGVLTRIRVCRIAGMVVNSQVSKQVNDMHAAWVAAGIPLSGGSFRTMSGQITIYQSWCARDGIAGSPPPYPKAPGQTIRCPGGGAPGYSNHQMGMAIDFNCDGSLIPRSYSAASKNKCFQWLSANAGKFGFFEYGYGKTRDGSTGYEGWHWSVNGN